MGSLDSCTIDPTIDVIDPDGDVFFETFSSSLGRQRRLRVSSQVLCLVSPVFDAMLGSTSLFKEASALRANGTAVVALGDDDDEALVIVMNAAHQNRHLIPTRISVKVLYEIAVLCDKYDMVRVVGSWPRMWANRLTPFPRRFGYGRVMAVAWLFGLDNIFSQVTREFIYCIKPEGAPLEQRDKHPGMDVHIVPHTIVDALRLRRLAALAAIFIICQDHIAKYTIAALEGLHMCRVLRPLVEQRKCDSKQAVALHMHLQALGFHPVQCTTDNRSIEEIIASLRVNDASKQATMEKAHVECCALQRIEEDLRDLLEDVTGLGLSGFRREGVEWTPDCTGEYQA